MWWGKIVVGVIGLLLFVATELFYPVSDNNPKLKHFWAIIIFIFSVVLGLPIELSLEIQNTLNEHSKSSFAVGRFQYLDAAYDKNFGRDVLPVLNGWANSTLDYLQDSWNRGMMPLPQEKAADQIGRVYADAKESIIATNVGSTKVYFANQNYIDSNNKARGRGVVIVRFFLYTKTKRIEMRNGQVPRNMDEFLAEVRALTAETGSLYSLVIDTDAHPLPKVWDILIEDNQFGAQTELADDWRPIRALATQNPQRLQEFRDYLHDLMGVRDSHYIAEMPAGDVKRFFSSRFKTVMQSNDPATAIFDSVMESVLKH